MMVIILVFNLILMNFSNLYTYGSDFTPEYIKVGLFFSNSQKSILNLKGSMAIGTYNGNQFTELLNLNQENNVFVRKDAFYINVNGSYVEFTGDINSSGNNNVMGPFHVQVANNFNNREQALELINSSSISDNPYLVYEDGSWKVFAGLYTNAELAQNAANAIQLSSGLNATVVSPSPTRVQVLNSSDKVLFMYDSKQELHFKTNSTINVDGKNYRGSITVKRQSSSDMTVINYLSLEEYLYGVVPREMPASWPREALKAQAVAARSFAIKSYNKYSHLGFNVCNTVNSQVYAGCDGEHPNSNSAVDETRGEVITHNGKIIDVFFHSNSGGQTENSENIWSAVVPYIRGVKDDYSLDTPNSTWNVIYSREKIQSLLEKNNIFVGEVIEIVVTSRSNNGRILTLEVIGTNGKEVMQKQRSRTVLDLKSSWFEVSSGSAPSATVVRNDSSQAPASLNEKHVITSSGITKLNILDNTRVYNGQQYKEVLSTTITASNGDFVFNGRGFGHGLGMSQHGAKKMAELNKTYDEILTHYYTGVKVE